MASGDVVLVQIGERRLAVPSQRVREVSAAGPVTPVPTAPAPVAGLTQIRGQIIPVLDIAEEPPRTPRPQAPLLVVELGQQRAALLCDHVFGVAAEPGDAHPLDVAALFDDVRGKVHSASRRP
jgi:chemotaxis signal transduction protein